MTFVFSFFYLYKLDTLNEPSFRNGQDFKKRKQVALTIENKQEVCKMKKKSAKVFYN